MTVTSAPAPAAIRFGILRRWPAPRWVRWSLLGLVVGSAALYSWNIGASGYSDYYATAAKSMSISWKAFFFGAFDPQSTITLDKLSGFLIPQALSARLFGFNDWALALPQLLEGLVTIVAAYFIISRWIGQVGGLIGATMMAFTPLLVSMFSHPMEDGMLTMFTTLAIGAWQRFIETDRRRYLLLAGALVGLGFQAKMMQAWLVLPAMALVYLWVVAAPLAQKFRLLVAAAGVTIAVSISWMTVFTLIPDTQRPFVDGTTDNNIFSMVFGYNGLNRFIHDFMPGALGSDPLPRPSAPGSTLGLVPVAFDHTPFKLFFPEYASQIGWFYPLAIAGLVLGLLEFRKARARTGLNHGMHPGVLLSGTLLLTLGAVMSVMSLPHTAYLASMAFPLAALSAIGVVLLWRKAQEATSPLRFALPVTVAAETAWALVLIANFPPLAEWLLAPIGILGFVAALVMWAHALGRQRTRRLTRFAAVAALTGTFLGPLVWSLSTLDPAYAGTANDAYAGPPALSAVERTATEGRYGIGLDSNRDADLTSLVEDKIYDYARAHSVNRKYVLATDTWRSAAPLIMRGVQRVLPVGGYTSRVTAPSLAVLAQLVATNELKYVLLTSQASKSSLSTTNISEMGQWVRSTCRLVPEQSYLPGPPGDSNWNRPTDWLYDCAP
ncbi:MAG: glycosyltransferase family 39 protein [Lacisediminihabitans sp.]